ncbi:MAG: hypothetical protein ACM3MK_06965 [Chitinophagales bacterium]
MTKNDIRTSTLPFLQGILNNLPDEIRRKQGYGGCPLLGVGGGTGEGQAEPQGKYKEAGKAPTRSEIEAFISG